MNKLSIVEISMRLTTESATLQSRKQGDGEVKRERRTNRLSQTSINCNSEINYTVKTPYIP